MNTLWGTRWAEWSLRIALGLMYLYSGIDLLWHPSAWHWAINGLPLALSSIIQSIGIDTFLRVQGFGEIFLALLLLAWFLPRKVSGILGLLNAIEMILILFLVGIDAITFRDIGLAGAGFALFFLVFREGPVRMNFSGGTSAVSNMSGEPSKN